MKVNVYDPSNNKLHSGEIYDVHPDQMEYAEQLVSYGFAIMLNAADPVEPDTAPPITEVVTPPAPEVVEEDTPAPNKKAAPKKKKAASKKKTSKKK